MQWKQITAVAATVMLAVAACGTPSSNNGKGGANAGNAGTAQEKATDATAKGPAPELDGAKKGARQPSSPTSRRTPSTRRTSTSPTRTRSAS